MYRYILDRNGQFIYSFLMDTESGSAVEIHADKNESPFAAGGIYIGRVSNIAWGIKAAFVDIRPGVTCYLPLDSLRDPVYTKKSGSPDICQGDELLVQIVREAMGKKGPSLSTELALQGSLVVVHHTGAHTGVSRKIPAPRRNELKELAQSLRQEDCSFTIRTRAAQAEDEAIIAEAREISQRMRDMIRRAAHLTVYTHLNPQGPPFLERLSNLDPAVVSEIVTEDESIAESAGTVTDIPVRLYADPLLSLRKLYSLETILSKALSERVYLRSGAFLVIQATEALTAIDVNSGKSDISGKRGRDTKEKTVLRVNLDAARECMRQLRLRNISGMILIDFINMEDKASEDELMEYLRSLAARDCVPCMIVDITKLGLVEITRKKTERPLQMILAGGRPEEDQPRKEETEFPD
ncbi:MAG: ribonuclease E/G [Lachnospiraceae bacterium]|nr:ribonuclease E/G [Lachnospiraceae bacterium]